MEVGERRVLGLEMKGGGDRGGGGGGEVMKGFGSRDHDSDRRLVVYLLYSLSVYL